ncbi:MAG: hypothetical protein LBL49_03095 [Clostridiales Family XIII bacterium]|jgi:hypothetical protein|nr:hypothetical protein [Clostridiales Family XIII bacterium]
MRAITDSLKLLRNDVGYFQREANEIIGVTKAIVNRYELDLAMSSHGKILGGGKTHKRKASGNE